MLILSIAIQVLRLIVSYTSNELWSELPLFAAVMSRFPLARAALLLRPASLAPRAVIMSARVREDSLTDSHQG